MKSNQYGQVSLANAKKVGKAAVAIEGTVLKVSCHRLASHASCFSRDSNETSLDRNETVSFEMPFYVVLEAIDQKNVYDHFNLRLCDKLPTDCQQVANRSPTFGHLSADSRPTLWPET